MSHSPRVVKNTYDNVGGRLTRETEISDGVVK